MTIELQRDDRNAGTSLIAVLADLKANAPEILGSLAR